MIILALVVCILPSGYAFSSNISQLESVQKISLNNEKFMATVNPAIRRLVHFGNVKGPNVLWINDMLPKTLPQTGYINFGGEKAWLWPQSRWPNSGKSLNWPPRDDLIETPGFTILSKSKRELRVIGPPSRLAPIQIERRYELTDSGLIIDSRVIINGKNHAEGWATWSILQLPIPKKIQANAGHTLKQLSDNLFQPHFTITQLPDGMAELTADDKAGDIKIGMDSTRLIAVYTDYSVLFESSIRREEGTSYLPGERAQIFIRRSADTGPTMYGRDYLELEFTGPRISETSHDSWLRVSIQIVTHTQQKPANQ